MKKYKFINDITNSNLTRFLMLGLFFFITMSCETFQINAKNTPTEIIITSAGVNPTSANAGENVEFFANYYSSLLEENYKLYVCKSKKFNTNSQTCQDGSWCDSSDFTEENPLKCTYTTTPDETNRNSFSIFVCSEGNGCSSAFTDNFTITDSILDLAVPEEIIFEPMCFSFEGQTSEDNSLGDMQITSIGTKNHIWSVNLSAQNWQNENGDEISFDGDGISTGQLTVDLADASIESSSSSADITLGDTDSFSASVQNINIVTAGKKSQDGIFIIKNIRFDQFVPQNQKEGDYTSLVIFTIS